MNYLDLFSGIGGFAYGAYMAGFKCENHFFSEIDKYCVELYQKRFPEAIALGDITKINGKELREKYGDEWIITGGFPCQDISIAGNGAGLDGSRSGLWFEYWRLISELQPRFAIMENVGALSFRGLDRVLGSLSEIGYDAEWQDIRASDVGAPHRRERIWIVAYPNKDKQSVIAEHEQVSGKLAVPNSLCKSRSTKPRQQFNGAAQSFGNSKDEMEAWDELADAESTECEQSRDSWPVEPAVGRVAHGIPRRVDRLKGLGNSIVPQIAELIFKLIMCYTSNQE